MTKYPVVLAFFKYNYFFFFTVTGKKIQLINSIDLLTHVPTHN